MVVVDRRAVEVLHVHRRILVALQLAGKAPPLLQRVGELLVHAIVVEQARRLVAELFQVGEHIALRIDAFVELLVRRLAARAMQHPQRGRAAVAGRAVEIGEQHVKALQQRVVALAHELHVVPGQRAHVQQDEVEGRRAACGRGELQPFLALAGVELLQQGIGVRGIGRQRAVALAGQRAGGVLFGLAFLDRGHQWHAQDADEGEGGKAHAARQRAVQEQAGDGQHQGRRAHQAPGQLQPVVGAEAGQGLELGEHPLQRGQVGVVVQQGDGRGPGQHGARAPRQPVRDGWQQGQPQQQVQPPAEADVAREMQADLGQEIQVPVAHARSPCCARSRPSGQRARAASSSDSQNLR